MLLDQAALGTDLYPLLGQAAQRVQAEQAVFGSKARGPKDALFGMSSGQDEGSLDQADRTDPAFGVGLFSPPPQLRADLTAAAEEALDERRLGGRQIGRAHV